MTATFRIDGHDVFATTGGMSFDPRKPAVVFLHGAGFDRTVWRLQTRWFANHGRSVLADRIPRLIEASAEEAASFSCNAVVVGRSVALHDGAPKLAAALRAAGYSTHPLPLTEFIKSGGSAKCLTLRLDGEEAAAWKRAATTVP